MIKEIGARPKYDMNEIISANMHRPTVIKYQTPIPKKATIIEQDVENELIDYYENDSTEQNNNDVEIKELRPSIERKTPEFISIICKGDDIIATNKEDCDIEAKKYKYETNDDDKNVVIYFNVHDEMFDTNTNGSSILQDNILQKLLPLDNENNKIIENKSLTVDNAKPGDDAILYTITDTDKTASRVSEDGSATSDNKKQNRDDIEKEYPKPFTTDYSLTNVNERSLDTNNYDIKEEYKTDTGTSTNILYNENRPMKEDSMDETNKNEIELCNEKPVAFINIAFKSNRSKCDFEQENVTYDIDVSLNRIIDEVVHGTEQLDSDMEIKIETIEFSDDEDSDIDKPETDNCDTMNDGPVDKILDYDDEGCDAEDHLCHKAPIEHEIDEEAQPFQWPTLCLEDTHLDIPEPVNGEYICQHCSGIYGTEYDFTTHKCSQKPSIDFTAFNKTLKKSVVLSPDPIDMDIDEDEQKIDEQSKREREEGDLGPYVCYICKKSICAASGLKVHIRRHLKDLRYKCEYCEKRFVVLYDLDRHTALHLGGRRHRFMCELCVKPFVSKCSLIQHMRLIHCKKAMFTCKICGIPFPHEFRLKRHILRHIEYDTNQSTVIDESLKILESIEQRKKEMSKVLDESLKEVDSNEADLLLLEKSQTDLPDLQQSGVIDETLAITKGNKKLSNNTQTESSLEKQPDIIEQCLKLANIQESDGIDPQGPTSSNAIKRGKKVPNKKKKQSSSNKDVINPSFKSRPSFSNQAINANEPATGTRKTIRSYPRIEMASLKRKGTEQKDIKRSNVINESHDDINELKILSDSMDLEISNLSVMNLFDMSESNISKALSGSDVNAVDESKSEITKNPNQTEIDITDCNNFNHKASTSNKIMDLTKSVPEPSNNIELNVVDMKEFVIRISKTKHNNVPSINLVDEPDKPKSMEIFDLTELNDEVVETIELSDSDEPTAVEVIEKRTLDHTEATNVAAQNTHQVEEAQSTGDRTICLVAIQPIAIINADSLNGSGSPGSSNVLLLL